MLLRTHIIVSLFFILLFLPFVSARVLFIVVALVATLIPDIDTARSSVGRFKILRPFQYLTRHRHVLHSFTFALLVTLGFVLFLPVVAFGFFLGYSSHLFADCFTQRGIRAFYPSKKYVLGRLKTGSKAETGIFVIFLVLDIALIVFYIF